MIKELKNLFFFLIISLFFFLTLKYYFSDFNKKNSYRALIQIDKKITTFSNNLKLLTNDTNNVAEYLEQVSDKSKKTFNFWKLINNHDK